MTYENITETTSVTVDRDIIMFNISFLELAREKIRRDSGLAMAQFGITSKQADLIMGINPEQIYLLAASNIPLARFRFEDTALMEAIIETQSDPRSRTLEYELLLESSKHIRINPPLEKGLSKRKFSTA